MATMWITRNALTKGIYQMEGQIRDRNYFFVHRALGRYLIGAECFHTRHEAVERAELMREVELKRLEPKLAEVSNSSSESFKKLSKRIAKLKNLSFLESEQVA